MAHASRATGHGNRQFDDADFRRNVDHLKTQVLMSGVVGRATGTCGRVSRIGVMHDR